MNSFKRLCRSPLSGMSSSFDSSSLSLELGECRNMTTYRWVVDNFSTISTYLHSPHFPLLENDKVKFFLDLAPIGALNWFDGSHVMLQLRVNYCEKELPVRYRISILDNKGEMQLSQDGRAVFNRKCQFDIKSGLQYNIERNYILDNAERFLQNDKLTIYCEVFVSDETAFESKLTQLSQDLESVLQNAKFSDFTLVVGKKGFQVHKNILAARSPVFCAMFEHDQTKEAQEGKVEITDIALDVFEEFLHYIYTGKIGSLKQYASELFVAADKYQVHCLKSICERYLCANLTIESAVNVLLLADMHNSAEVKAKAKDFITRHSDFVMRTDGWKQLIKNRNLELVVELYQDMSAKAKDFLKLNVHKRIKI